MLFDKTRGGAWARGSEIKSGIRAKIMDEATRTVSRFQTADGKEKMQTVASVRFEDKNEPMNVSLNRATVYGLIDAFGPDSKDWIGKVLITHTDKTTVAGKRQIALYLVPGGFEVTEDEAGYVVVTKIGATRGDYPEPTADQLENEDSPF